MHEHAQGLGFRGDIFGGYILYNCGFIQSENRFFVNGEAVVDDKIYTLEQLICIRLVDISLY